jgi:hypothetical protein
MMNTGINGSRIATRESISNNPIPVFGMIYQFGPTGFPKGFQKNVFSGS